MYVAKKKILIGVASLAGIVLATNGLTSCNKNTKHTLTVSGDYFTIPEKGKEFTFEKGKEIKFQVKADEGYKVTDTVDCKFNGETKTRGTDYKFDDDTFVISSAPDCNINVSFVCSQETYKAQFVSAGEYTYTVKASKDFYHFKDKNIRYELTSTTGAIFPENPHIYYNGVEMTPDTGNYTYVQGAIESENLSSTATLVINQAPSCDFQFSILPNTKHVLYFELVNAKIGEDRTGYRIVEANKDTEEIEIKANDIRNHLPSREGVKVYMGGQETSNFDYDYGDQTSKIKIKNVTSYVSIYLEAKTDALIYEEIEGTNTARLVGLNPGYSEYVEDLQVNKEYNGKKVIEIADDAFIGDNNLKYVSQMGENVSRIGNRAFKNCPNLKLVPQGVASEPIRINASIIGDSAFEGCTSIEKFVDSSIYSIGAKAFSGCSVLQLEEYSLKLLRIVGDNAFEGCTKIGKYDFTNNTFETKPLIISTGDKGYGFDINNLGNNICEGWSKDQIIFFAGDINTAKLFNANNYNVKAREDYTYFYTEVEGGTKSLGSSKGGAGVTIAFSDLDTYSWQEINNISLNGLAPELWNIGDVKHNPKDPTHIEYRIIDFDHDLLVEQSGTRKYAGITFETTYLDDKQIVEFGSASGTGTYKDSALKERLNTIFDSDEFSDFKHLIKPVTKTSLYGHTGSYNTYTTSETLFPLSLSEVAGDLDSKHKPYEVEGNSYAYYKNETFTASEKRLKTSRQLKQVSRSYWLRTPYSAQEETIKRIYFVNSSSGQISWAQLTSTPITMNVSFAFCI